LPPNKIHNSYTSNSLLILTWNTHGLNRHKNELLATLQNKRIDVAFISETHFTNISTLKLQGYKCFHTYHPDDTAHAGAAIIVRSTLQFYPVPNYQTLHVQACTISLTLNHQPITISAAYCPPRHNITPNQFNNYFNYVGSKFIIGET